MYPTDKNFIEQLDRLIDRNLQNENYSIEDICTDLGMSRSQLFRLMKEQTDLSTSRYIRRRRLLKGKELLDTTDLRIVEIASGIGFDSPQTFSKYFAEDFGTSPTEYRKNRENKTQPAPLPPKEVIASAPESPSPATSPAPAPQRPKYRYVALVVAAVVLAAAGFLWLTKTGKTANESENSIAVLPFKSNGSPEAMLLAEGIAEQIHASLTTLENLRVISKNSSQLFKDSPKTLPQIAAQLNVAYVLDGTATRTGERIRVSIELVKGDEDRVIWTRNYEGKAPETIAFINKIAKETVAQLQQKTAKPRIDKSMPTANPEAYNEYLQGQQLLATRTKEKMLASLEKMDKVLALDPDFADAYAHKAAAYFMLGNLNYIDLDSSFRLAEREALKAIQLDAQNARAYGLLAAIYRDQYKWEQAYTTFQIALRCNPNDAQVNYWYSLMLRSLGLLDEAMEYSAKAVALDPLYPVILAGHISNCSYADKREKVNEALQKGELLFNDSYLFYWAKGYHFLDVDEYPKALRYLTKARELNPSLKSITAAIAYTQARLGQSAAAKNYAASLPETPDHYEYLAMVYAGLKDKENCFRYLEQMAAAGQMPTDLKVSAHFKFLHGDKRFDKLLQRFGLLNFQLPT